MGGSDTPVKRRYSWAHKPSTAKLQGIRHTLFLHCHPCFLVLDLSIGKPLHNVSMSTLPNELVSGWLQCSHLYILQPICLIIYMYSSYYLPAKHLDKKLTIS